jgi:hypothetical protein
MDRSASLSGALPSSCHQQKLLKKVAEDVPASQVVGAPPPQLFSHVPA